MKSITKGSKKGNIVCIHGNSSSAKVFEELLESDQIPNTIITFDLKGHGNNQSKDYSIEDFTFESQKTFLSHQLSKIDEDILLVGNSLGGHLAIELAKENTNIKGLVIMGTPPVKKPLNFEEAFIPVEALNTFLTESPTEEEVSSAFELVISNKSKLLDMISDFKNANPLVRTVTVNDLMQDKLLNQYDIFTKLTIPKYIISGDNDISVNRDYLETVKNNCETSCSIIDVENCGHYPSVDKPKEFIEIVKNIASEVFN